MHNRLDCIRKNLSLAREKALQICTKSHRDPAKIHLMAVTKGRSEEEIQAAFSEGVRLFGENRIQEVQSKAPLFFRLREVARKQNESFELHMIGHLQSNKVKDAVELFDVIESIDSLPLFAKIHAEAKRRHAPCRVFIQVNISRDPKKFGIQPEGILEFFRQSHEYITSGYIMVDGLMTMVEHTDRIQDRQPFFGEMHRLLSELRTLFPEGHIEHCPFRFLSMGMSEDFDLALQEGSNLIRLGRFIFEPHPRSKASVIQYL